MRLGRFSRRPSPSLVITLLALFLRHPDPARSGLKLIFA